MKDDILKLKQDEMFLKVQLMLESEEEQKWHGISPQVFSINVAHLDVDHHTGQISCSKFQRHKFDLGTQ